MNAEPSGERLRLARGCRLSDAPGQEHMLMLPESAMKLNISAQRIVKLCDGTRSVAEMIGKLRAEFPEASGGQLERDTLLFLDELRRRGALEYL
jgi:pyrroloquinoline quinone biosynthesis protein D